MAILLDKKTKYHHIRVEEDGDIRSMTFLNDFGSSMFTQSSIDLSDLSRHVLNYSRCFMYGCDFFGMDGPHRVLIIGLGGGTIARHLVMKYPNIEIDILELDQGVVDVSKEYFYFEESDRVRVIVGDAWNTLEGLEGLGGLEGYYDWVISDAFNHSSAPFPLLTEDFNMKVYSKLFSPGLFSINLVKSHPLFSRYMVTLESVFGDDTYYVDGVGNSIMFFNQGLDLGIVGSNPDILDFYYTDEIKVAKVFRLGVV